MDFTGDDPLKFVIEKNILRRHLTESQRAMLAAGLANAKEGRPSQTGQICPVSTAAAAKALKVSTSSVKHGKKVRAKGTAALQQAVQDDKVSVSAAAKIAELPADQQNGHVAKVSAPRARAKSKDCTSSQAS